MPHEVLVKIDSDVLQRVEKFLSAKVLCGDVPTICDECMYRVVQAIRDKTEAVYLYLKEKPDNTDDRAVT